MTTDMQIAATSFACVMSFTPGPNNILLTASGVNFGFTRSIPHILGVKFGFVALVAACGLGLGLYIARRIVELHDGSLTVSSAGKQQGSTFTVRLPRIA